MALRKVVIKITHYNTVCSGVLVHFLFLYNNEERARIARWLERQTRDPKVSCSNPGRSGGRIFFSRINYVCWLLFGVRSTPVLPQWHMKDPDHLPKVQVAGYTSTRILPWPNKVGVGWPCRCPGVVWEPIRKRAHTQLIKEHSASRRSSLSHWWLILA